MAFQDFAFVIYSTPKVVPFAVNHHKNLILVPLPIRGTTSMVTRLTRNLLTQTPDQSGPENFVAYIDTQFVKQVLNVTKKKWGQT
tara:strand:+ start:234 stop:488 length:255 start_codon:yes stop_codon:yes gene_type:complete